MSNIAFRLRLTYKNVDEEIPNLDYKVTFQSLVFPTALLHKDLKCKAPLIEPNLRRNLGKWST